MSKWRDAIKHWFTVKYWSVRLWWKHRILFTLAELPLKLGLKLVRVSQKYRNDAIILKEIDYESRYDPPFLEDRY
jgi:hypothetical protein